MGQDGMIDWTSGKLRTALGTRIGGTALRGPSGGLPFGGAKTVDVGFRPWRGRATG